MPFLCEIFWSTLCVSYGSPWSERFFLGISAPGSVGCECPRKLAVIYDGTVGEHIVHEWLVHGSDVLSNRVPRNFSWTTSFFLMFATGRVFFAPAHSVAHFGDSGGARGIHSGCCHLYTSCGSPPPRVPFVLLCLLLMSSCHAVTHIYGSHCKPSLQQGKHTNRQS